MNHTPGPWKRIAIGGNGRQVISSGHGWLVELPKRGEPETDLQAQQLEADYDLMAAAPELLAACQEAYRLMKNSPGNWESQTAEMLYEAISNAEGKATV